MLVTLFWVGLFRLCVNFSCDTLCYAVCFIGLLYV